MATNFPTSLDIFTNPAATDNLATVSHAAQHDNVNDSVAALEAKVGINNSLVTTSIDYLLKHPNALSTVDMFQVSGGGFGFGTCDLSTISGTTVSMGSGTIFGVTFIAPQTKTYTAMSVAINAGGTAATYAAQGVYSVDTSGNLTQIAVTANGNAQIGTTNAMTKTSTISSYMLTAGNVYAALILQTAAGGGVSFWSAPLSATFFSNTDRVPARYFFQTGQTVLPASLAVGSQTATTNGPYFHILP